jgi:hypothetical protein
VITITVMISVAIVMGNMVMTVRMAALLLRLPRRNVAVAPALFLSFVPAGGALAVVTIVVAVAVVVTVGVAVFIVVLVVAVPAFGEGTRSERKAKHESKQKLVRLGSHWGTLLRAREHILCHSKKGASYQR